jgi:hypothetical protein
MTARYWAPMLDPASATALYPAGLDAPTRLRILADGYGLSLRERAELPGTIEQATAVCRAFVARRVADGDTIYLQALAERGDGNAGTASRIGWYVTARRSPPPSWNDLLSPGEQAPHSLGHLRTEQLHEPSPIPQLNRRT